MEIGICGQVDLDERPFGLSHGGEIIVGGQRLAHLEGADIESGHAIGLELDAHGKGPGTENIGTLYSFDGRKTWLYNADEIIGYLVLLKNV